MNDAMADDAKNRAYRVLARKYRPKGFEDLIGQEAMVRTLTNAFAAERVHQAYIFTGVRGVGKTTTARIVARALNYELEDGSITGPTIAMDRFGRHCEAIIESRHVDVIEMDAASNTGVDNMREIIEAVRYRPAYARHKVYIIDEVHMLSNASFNALLKTLEEPPEHVKFLFATTEIKKVPVTVLSRCQRFDLKRIEQGLMIGHLSGICALEKVEAADEALALIARAGEGSVRDCLSLLDQAIAHALGGSASGGRIEADQVRSMLGLSDRARVVDLFETVMKGEIAAALGELGAQYESGADPAGVIADLAEYVHTVTRLKLASNAEADATLTETERRRGQAFAAELSIRALTRAWQILSRGLSEVQAAPRPIVAAEMLLVRLAYAAELPMPDEALRLLREGAAASAAPARPPAPRGGGNAVAALPRPTMAAANPAPRPATAPAAPALRLDSFQHIVALAQEKRDALTVAALERDVRLVRCEDGMLEFNLAPEADAGLVQRLAKKLQDWTGRRWSVALSNQAGDPTIRELREAKRAEEESLRHKHPVVQAVLQAFPGATVLPAQPKAPLATEAAPSPQTLAQGYVDEDGDVVVGDIEITEEDL